MPEFAQGLVRLLVLTLDLLPLRGKRVNCGGKFRTRFEAIVLAAP
jgi:hypothetical protein